MSPQDRVDVARLQSVVDGTFARAAALYKEIDVLSRVHSDMAKYLCVLVSSYLESALHQLLLEHCQDQSGPRVQRFVEIEFQHWTNANTPRILLLLERFDPDWKTEAEKALVGSLKDSVDSVVNIRNGIAHGRDTGITYRQIEVHYAEIREVIKYLTILIRA